MKAWNVLYIKLLRQTALKKEGRLRCVLFYVCKGRIKDSGCIDMLFRDILFLCSAALPFGWLMHLCISDENFNIKTGFMFVGMLVLFGITCYATLN